MELGVFDIDNESGLWDGEYGVNTLIEKLREINSTQFYEIDLDVSELTDDFFNQTGMSNAETVHAVYFGNIKSLNNAYIGFDGYGNFKTYSETEYQEEIAMYVKDLGLF
ncbi:hypothetical protein [Pseudolactococcus paracarnosus]|uniref:Uncharacterized protein n=1 Tax=Pseudolactococcus paracarnosus TaxID=2749962 RepID=A0ABT0AP39_9LACT|nr:hypothetical protein [Lactococcus paracarnosus]MCJ1978306.1 hypothetical protein [Lactococcus paracarnosus]MCJ1984477.1 hypothetical protein [Lactococcus paracarnosus]MCJ1999290.1 hypothetical protein [Lactococcus paracarnosus]